MLGNPVPFPIIPPRPLEGWIIRERRGVDQTEREGR